MRCAPWVALVVAAACGGSSRPAHRGAAAPTRPLTVAERMLAMLPDGVEILVELDLDRLRGNAVVGDLATKALSHLGASSRIPGLPLEVQGSPLANADLVVLAAYGVGTAHAATVTILATTKEVTNAARLAPDLVALGPPEWLEQLEARAHIAAQSPLAPTLELMPLRDHAMPKQAPGAVLRVTARLPFDARVALARQTGLDTPPAQLSVWGDIVDDLAIVIDADAVDPGDKRNKDAANRVSATLNTVLTGAAQEPAIKALGLAPVLSGAHMIVQGTWVRTIISVGPRHLARVVERARAMLGT